MAWSKQCLHDWLQLALAPAKLKRLISKQFTQQIAAQAGFELEAELSIQGPPNWQEPFAQIPLFWRKQLPAVDHRLLEKSWHWYQQQTNTERGFWVLGQPDYPVQLSSVANPPWLLCWEGEPTIAHSHQVAVIGSRKASPQALLNTTEFATQLAAAGLTITSGLAMGVDNASHWAALNQAKPTCAVLGCGIDMCYPPRARALKKEIQQYGLVVSEYLPGTPAKTEHFPARNRIISGLSRGVLVMAAAKRSGSLITARLAAEQGKDVFAVPYGLHDPTGSGCHWLIQQGAKLVTSAADIIDDWAELSLPHSSQPSESQQEMFQTGLENAIMLDNVGFETTSFDQLLQQSQLSVAEAMNELVSLEVDGWIKAVPGGYVRVRR
ncbi:MAG TPA: DNA-processing protein DprA [Aliidiomarina sp.]|nr:DNA-processing protein DprA [Aliidiomarina sp.]